MLADAHNQWLPAKAPSSVLKISVMRGKLCLCPVSSLFLFFFFDIILNMMRVIIYLVTMLSTNVFLKKKQRWGLFNKFQREQKQNRKTNGINNNMTTRITDGLY